MKHITNDLSANETIYEAIRQIAFHKLVNPRTNVMKNTSKISGYVVKVHTDKNIYQAFQSNSLWKMACREVCMKGCTFLLSKTMKTVW